MTAVTAELTARAINFASRHHHDSVHEAWIDAILARLAVMPSGRGEVRVRRVYDEPGDDGVRVLVDRVWPRGLRKEAARLDAWRKDLAPSTALRTWYGHDPDRFAEFRRRYEAELAEAAGTLAELRALAGSGRLTLLTATRDVARSNAQVLADLLSRPR